MSDKKKRGKNTETDNLRLDPDLRLCSRFDEYSIAEYPLPEPEEMGMRVIDNCAEEHMM